MKTDVTAIALVLVTLTVILCMGSTAMAQNWPPPCVPNQPAGVPCMGTGQNPAPNPFFTPQPVYTPQQAAQDEQLAREAYEAQHPIVCRTTQERDWSQGGKIVQVTKCARQ